MYFKQIFEPKLSQYAYLIGCSKSNTAVIVDPLRDIDRYIEIAKQDGFKIVAATETHIHADYLSGLREFAELDGVTVYASDEGDKDWKYEWLVGSSYDYHLLKDGDTITVGSVTLTAKRTPGHTPEHIIFFINENLKENLESSTGIISGDFVFVGDVGRPDLLETAAGQIGSMEKSASVLFDSLQLFKEFVPELTLWPGHGAGSACGKSLGTEPSSTVGDELRSNISILKATEKDVFVKYILEGQPEPPPYFGRMKTLNRTGPQVLGNLPSPRNISAEGLRNVVSDTNAVLVDTRSWDDFKKGHLNGALYIPMTSAFSTLVGSYITPESNVCLIVTEADLDEALRHFVRVGVDNVVSFVTPKQFLTEFISADELVGIDEFDVSNADGAGKLLDSADVLPVDVRRSTELVDSAVIGAALNIPHTQLRMRYTELPKDRKLAVYCKTGARSMYAAAYLSSRGYDAAHVVGGIDKWLESRQ